MFEKRPFRHFEHVTQPTESVANLTVFAHSPHLATFHPARREVIARHLPDMDEQVDLSQSRIVLFLSGDERVQRFVFPVIAARMVAKYHGIARCAKTIHRFGQFGTPSSMASCKDGDSTGGHFRVNVSVSDPLDHPYRRKVLDAEAATGSRRQIDMHGTAALAFEFEQSRVHFDLAIPRFLVVSDGRQFDFQSDDIARGDRPIDDLRHEMSHVRKIVYRGDGQYRQFPIIRFCQPRHVIARSRGPGTTEYDGFARFGR